MNGRLATSLPVQPVISRGHDCLAYSCNGVSHMRLVSPIDGELPRSGLAKGLGVEALLVEGPVGAFHLAVLLGLCSPG